MVRARGTLLSDGSKRGPGQAWTRYNISRFKKEERDRIQYWYSPCITVAYYRNRALYRNRIS